MLTSIFLQEAAAASGSGMSTIIMIVLMIAIFYFFMIRPQNKERKRMRDFLDSLQVGSKVRTASGVYGKVKEIKDNVIILEIADNVKIKIDKNYIVGSAEAPVQESK
ncbi:MAG: preprotein translocase subunit YajC [Bacteroidales bacterium]|nr:preprotein translocase subunit YajC [Bacteroidales bacterium]